jgi:hypothetical protein
MGNNVWMAVALVLAAVRVGSADSIMYATWGQWDNSDASVVINNAAGAGGGSTIAVGGAGGSSLGFTGVTDLVDSPSTVPLGIFSTTTPLTAGQIDAYNGTTFTLTIDQLDPGDVVGTVAGTLTGTLRKSANGAGASTLHLAWGGASVTLNGVSYAPHDTDIAGATATTPTTLQGLVSGPEPALVPAPAAGWAGLSLASILFLRRALPVVRPVRN